MRKNVKAPEKQRLKSRIGWLLFLGVAVYMIWPFLATPGQMSNFCKSLAMGVGSTQSQVQALVAEQGYRMNVNGQGSGVIFDLRSMGRFTCSVQFSQGQLISAKYMYND